jgi:hypothetical protein
MLIGEDDSESTIGNLEGGVHYARHQGDTAYVLHAGLTLPTAGDSTAALVTNTATTWGRITDVALAAPETWWLRLGGSVIFQSGDGFLRADLGLDAPVSSDIDPETLVRCNFGAGFKGADLAFMFELATVGNLGGEGDVSERFLHTAAFTLGALSGRTRAGFVVPLDEDLRGDVFIFSFAFRFGAPGKPEAATRSAVGSDDPCEAHIAAWRDERDARRKTELYDSMPARCRDRLRGGAPAEAEPAAPAAPTPPAPPPPADEPPAPPPPEAPAPPADEPPPPVDTPAPPPPEADRPAPAPETP